MRVFREYRVFIHVPSYPPTRLVGQVSLFQAREPDLGECCVVHIRRYEPTLMFNVTGRACCNVSMKFCRLTLKERCVVGVAGNAVHSFDALIGRVTGGTVIFQEGVCAGEWSRTAHMLPG